MEERRFHIEKPPIPLDCVRDALVDPETANSPTVPVGHGQAFIDGAYYEQDRILDVLHDAGISLPEKVLDRIMGE